MRTNSEKIYHHHTPRFYLLPWADADERVAWLGYGKIKRSKVTVVGGENGFYRLQELTDDDVLKMRQVIELTLPKDGCQIHENFLAAFSLPPAWKKDLELIGNNDPQVSGTLDLLIANSNEDYHMAIENSFQPYLEAMRRGDASFYEDDKHAMEFLYDFSVQMFRTKRMSDAVRDNANGFIEGIGRVWPILCHMYAATIGGSFFVDRRRFKIVLIDNDTQVPFVTSDQPIINLLAQPSVCTPPEKVEFYYPLSPTKAMLYLENSNRAHACNRSVSVDEAHAYNCTMADYSGQQIFSNSEEYLKVLQRRQKEQDAPIH